MTQNFGLCDRIGDISDCGTPLGCNPTIPVLSDTSGSESTTINDNRPPNSDTALPQPPKLLDQLRHRCRTKHYFLRTEEAYVGWGKRFILFHHKRHPKEMGKLEVEQFLTHLAVERNTSASTQN